MSFLLVFPIETYNPLTIYIRYIRLISGGVIRFSARMVKPYSLANYQPMNLQGVSP